MSLPPPRKTELFYDGTWNDITHDMRDTSALTISRGRSSESSRTEPANGSAVVDNREGLYSPRDPMSPLYGLIGRNTPIRHSVYAGGPWMERVASGDAFTTPDNAQHDLTNDIDLRVEITSNDWAQDGELVGKYQISGNNRSWAFDVQLDGTLLFIWSPDGTLTNRLFTESTAAVPAHNGQRIAVRVTLDVNNGASGNTTTFYWANSINGTWRQLGSPVVLSGTTSIFNGAAQIELGGITDLVPSALDGKIHALQLLNGIDGTKIIDLDFANYAPGTTTFTDDTGLVWTRRGTAELTNKHVRLEGEVPAWPPERDLSGNDRYSPITPAGIMRRLDSGTKPLDSALMRFIRGAGPVECWPLTDGAQAEVATSLVGGTSMTEFIEAGTASIAWSDGELADWIEPVALAPASTDGTLLGYVPSDVSAGTEWSVDLCRAGIGDEDSITIGDLGAGTDAENRIGWSLEFSATNNRIQLFFVSVGETASSFTLLSTITTAGIFNEDPHHIRLTVNPGASSSSWRVWVDGVSRGNGTHGVGSKAVRSIRYGWFLGSISSNIQSFGFLTYWNESAPSASDTYQALLGFPGELSGTRAARIATELGITLSVGGLEELETTLGAQRRERFLDALDTIAKADVGYFGERRDARELIYRGHGAVYNQDPVLTLDFSAGLISAPFRPIDDDKLTENDVTVRRDGGGRGVAVLEEGAMSVLDPPTGVGRYDVEYTRNLETDSQPEQLANWLLNLGTFDGLRYKQITLDLANPRVYAMVDSILRADIGDLIRLTNLPATHGPDDVDLIIQGYSEEMSPEAWKITFICSPGEPWRTGVTNADAKAGSEVCTLTGDHTSTDTSLDVSVPTGSTRWADSATYPDEFPMLMKLGGETVRVTAITGTSLSQVLTVVRSVNGVVKAHTSGTPIDLATPARVAL